MGKSAWKLSKGKYAFVTKTGKRGIASSMAAARTKAGTKKRRKTTRKKTRTRRSRVRRKVTRVARRRYRRKKKSGGSKAISINLAKLAVVAYAAGTMAQGVSFSGDYLSTMKQPFENLKANWRSIVPAAIGVTILSRLLGRFAPRVGIKNALSIKAF